MDPCNPQIWNCIFISSEGEEGGMIKRIPHMYLGSLIEILPILFTHKVCATYTYFIDEMTLRLS